MRLDGISRSRFVSDIRIVYIELCFQSSASFESVSIGDDIACKAFAKYLDAYHNVLFGIFTRISSAHHIRIQSSQTFTADNHAEFDHGLLFERAMNDSPGLPTSNNSSFAHWPIPDYESPSALFLSIFTAVVRADIQLDAIEFIGFACDTWRSRRAPSNTILSTLHDSSRMQHLTTLVLELDLFQGSSNEAPALLINILKRSSSLKSLDLVVKPGFSAITINHEEACHGLLHCMGSSPPFGLEYLRLMGLVANSDMTLDRVIRAHSKTLKQLHLRNVQFNYPNTLRGLWGSLLDTDIERFAIRKFMLNGSCSYNKAALHEKTVGDECLQWDANEDESYKDWVMWTLEKRDSDHHLVWDAIDRRGRYGSIKDDFIDEIMAIDCGACRDLQ